MHCVFSFDNEYEMILRRLSLVKSVFTQEEFNKNYILSVIFAVLNTTIEIIQLPDGYDFARVQTKGRNKKNLASKFKKNRIEFDTWLTGHSHKN